MVKWKKSLKSQDNVLLKISFGKNTIVKNLNLRNHEKFSLPKIESWGTVRLSLKNFYGINYRN